MNRTYRPSLRSSMIAIVFAVLPCIALADSAEEAVVRRDRDLNALLIRRDAAAAAFYDERFVLTTSSGKMKGKADLLAEVNDDSVRLDVNETSDAIVRTHGTTAVLTGILHQRGMYKGKPFDNRLHVTDTWVLSAGQWKLLAGHATLMPSIQRN
jgi:hypothetical protein